MKICCDRSDDGKHKFVDSTFIQKGGKFDGHLMLKKKCIHCDASFETLFERAMTLYKIDKDKI